jgi:hypothetical protein
MMSFDERWKQEQQKIPHSKNSEVTDQHSPNLNEIDGKVTASINKHICSAFLFAANKIYIISVFSVIFHIFLFFLIIVIVVYLDFICYHAQKSYIFLNVIFKS